MARISKYSSHLGMVLFIEASFHSPQHPPRHVCSTQARVVASLTTMPMLPDAVLREHTDRSYRTHDAMSSVFNITVRIPGSTSEFKSGGEFSGWPTAAVTSRMSGEQRRQHPGSAHLQHLLQGPEDLVDPLIEDVATEDVDDSLRALWMLLQEGGETEVL